MTCQVGRLTYNIDFEEGCHCRNSVLFIAVFWSLSDEKIFQALLPVVYIINNKFFHFLNYNFIIKWTKFYLPHPWGRFWYESQGASFYLCSVDVEVRFKNHGANIYWCGKKSEKSYLDLIAKMLDS